MILEITILAWARCPIDLGITNALSRQITVITKTQHITPLLGVLKKWLSQGWVYSFSKAKTGNCTRGGWPAKLQEYSFLIFFPTFNHVNLNIVKKGHVNQKMVNIGWPQITILASDHLIWAHSSALGPLLIPKTSWLSYTMRPSCMSKNKIQGGQRMTLLAPYWLIFSKGNGWNFVPHQPLDLFP